MSNNIPTSPRQASWIGKLIEYSPALIEAGVGLYKALREPAKPGAPLPRIRTARELLLAAAEHVAPR